MKGVLQRSSSAMDLSMWNEAMLDAREASEFGVNTDEEYQLFNYVDMFVEDVASDVFGDKLSYDEEKSLKKFLFQSRTEFDFNELSSFWTATVKWLKEKSKNKYAYPNVGENGYRYVKRDNTYRWAELANEVRKAILKGKQEIEALAISASRLPEDERLEFKAWYRFKFSQLKNLYDVNKKIKEQSEGNMKILRRANSKFGYITESENRYYLPDFRSVNPVEEETMSVEDFMARKQKEEAFQEARSKLVSRTFAIDKLLERYFDVLSPEDIAALEDYLNALRKKIRQLKCADTVQDVMIKAANMFERKGFKHGKDELDLLLADYFNVPIVKKAVAVDTSALSEIITKLQELSNELKGRDIVREIARLDFKLHDMNISALFPELSDAQGKLIDATAYASNKLDSVIPKMRSVMTRGEVPGKPQPGAPVSEKPPAVKSPSVAPSAPPKAPSAPPAQSPLDELAKDIEGVV